MEPYRAESLDPVSHSSASNEALLMRRYAHLVKRACSHLRSQVSASFGMDDFEQVGLMGLLEAIRRYGTPDEAFESFAFKRVRGAILDELRRQDWRPRQVRQAAHDFNHNHRKLYNRLGREPSEQEVADEMGITIEQVRELVYANQACEMQHLDDWLVKELEPAGGNSDVFEIKRTLAKVLCKLNPREQLLLTLYYQHELNMKEIAQVLGLTESRVCQLHKECLSNLNSFLERH
ncbi:FliA/WhiG family RNA polymerase sigma factor [Gallaecimonas pentaromativorans]|uniref:RNA polymerase sigma-28 (SigD/FliA/WhiG) subunit n=1 Tax=Gallaecimonas pentaromativorans TaxID=584787 RepID=A0A3N1PG97_9GAMM|nr:FliA/WhiG family RNA polymerase sigma factor [Gallaecimonas pentaromativorans]MED5526552.1 FliA/WhiG family RNA polymerase sigma factor [Pseudomonadota bacterium]ROQ25890.1 RNA polymerase sigma-28 (SigD/FliA/WhiG) subunit [Gallaecimonas pentaromativorans]